MDASGTTQFFDDAATRQFTRLHVVGQIVASAPPRGQHRDNADAACALDRRLTATGSAALSTDQVDFQDEVVDLLNLALDIVGVGRDIDLYVRSDDTEGGEQQRRRDDEERIAEIVTETPDAPASAAVDTPGDRATPQERHAGKLRPKRLLAPSGGPGRRSLRVEARRNQDEGAGNGLLRQSSRVAGFHRLFAPARRAPE